MSDPLVQIEKSPFVIEGCRRLDLHAPLVQIEKSPSVIAAWRTAETAAVVSVLAFLGSLQAALTSPHGLAGYDWRSALAALALGLVSGGVNGLIAGLNLWLQRNRKP